MQSKMRRGNEVVYHFEVLSGVIQHRSSHAGDCGGPDVVRVPEPMESYHDQTAAEAIVISYNCAITLAFILDAWETLHCRFDRNVLSRQR